MADSEGYRCRDRASVDGAFRRRAPPAANDDDDCEAWSEPAAYEERGSRKSASEILCRKLRAELENCEAKISERDSEIRERRASLASSRRSSEARPGGGAVAAESLSAARRRGDELEERLRLRQQTVGDLERKLASRAAASSSLASAQGGEDAGVWHARANALADELRAKADRSAKLRLREHELELELKRRMQSEKAVQLDLQRSVAQLHELVRAARAAKLRAAATSAAISADAFCARAEQLVPSADSLAHVALEPAPSASSCTMGSCVTSLASGDGGRRHVAKEIAPCEALVRSTEWSPSEAPQIPQAAQGAQALQVLEPLQFREAIPNILPASGWLRPPPLKQSSSTPALPDAASVVGGPVSAMLEAPLIRQSFDQKQQASQALSAEIPSGAKMPKTPLCKLATLQFESSPRSTRRQANPDAVASHSTCRSTTLQMEPAAVANHTPRAGTLAFSRNSSDSRLRCSTLPRAPSPQRTRSPWQAASPRPMPQPVVVARPRDVSPPRTSSSPRPAPKLAMSPRPAPRPVASPLHRRDGGPPRSAATPPRSSTPPRTATPPRSTTPPRVANSTGPSWAAQPSAFTHVLAWPSGAAPGTPPLQLRPVDRRIGSMAAPAAPVASAAPVAAAGGHRAPGAAARALDAFDNPGSWCAPGNGVSREPVAPPWAMAQQPGLQPGMMA